MVFKLLVLVFFLIGCGSTSTTTSQNTKGYLVDARVSGVEYYCDEIQGLTDTNGMFYFNYSCNDIIFKIGSVTLATMSTSKVNLDNIFYITDIAQRNTRIDTNNTSVKNIIRLLQSLDDDYNPENGINITQTIRDNITNTIPFDISSENINDTDLNNILIDANTNNELVTATRALVHFEQTLRDNELIVDTVPPYKPSITSKIVSTDNDSSYIDLRGEKNTSIWIKTNNTIQSVNTNKTIYSDGKYNNFELNTSGFKNLFYDFNITLKDDLNQTSEILSISIFKDTDDVSPYTFPEDINITSPNKNVIDLNITDNSEDYGLSLDYELSGLHASYFEVNSTNGKVSFKNDSIAGNTYQLTIIVSDKANHKRSGDIVIIVK